MSYNISHINVKKCSLTIRAAAFRELQAKAGDDIPEVNLFDEDAHELSADGQTVTIRELWWSGEFSGRSLEFLTDELLPATTGHLKGTVVWEGGESLQSLIVTDGVVKLKDL